MGFKEIIGRIAVGLIIIAVHYIIVKIGLAHLRITLGILFTIAIIMLAYVIGDTYYGNKE